VLIKPARAQYYNVLADDNMSVALAAGLTIQERTRLVEEAYKRLRDAQVLMPRDATISRKLSNVRRNQGRFDEALAFIKQGVTLAPTHAPLRAEQGRLAMMMEDYPAAIEAFGQAVELYPLKGQYHGELARAYAAAEQWPEAYAAAERAVETASNDESRAAQLANLAGIYQAQDKLEEAAQALQRAIDVAPRPFKPAYQQLLDEFRRSTAAPDSEADK
jgi:tetratricopeptide (TPR) repeat protein